MCVCAANTVIGTDQTLRKQLNVQTEKAECGISNVNNEYI